MAKIKPSLSKKHKTPSASQTPKQKETAIFEAIDHDLGLLHQHLVNYIVEDIGGNDAELRGVIDRNIYPYITTNIDEMLEEDLSPKNPTPESTLKTKALTAHWLIRILTTPTLLTDEPHPGNVPQVPAGVFELHEFIYNNETAPQMLGRTTIVNNHDFKEILQVIAKINLLRYIAQHHSEIQRPHAPDDADFTHPEQGIALFNLQWLKTQATALKNLAQAPENLPAPSKPVPALASFKPIKQKQPISPRLELWQQFWNTHYNTPWEDRLSIVALFKNSPAITPVNSPSPVTRFYFSLLFWLHIPIIRDIFHDHYLLAFQATFKACRKYVQGKKPFFSLLSPTLDNPLFGVTLALLKILFAPILLLGPLVIGITSLPFQLIKPLIGSLDDNVQRSSGIIGLGLSFLSVILSIIETIKDLALLCMGLAWWSHCLAIIALPAALLSLSSIAASAMTIVSAIALVALFSSQSVDVGEEAGSIFDLAFNIANSHLFRLTWLVCILTAPVTLITLVSSRLLGTLLKGVSPEVAEKPTARVKKKHPTPENDYFFSRAFSPLFTYFSTTAEHSRKNVAKEQKIHHHRHAHRAR